MGVCVTYARKLASMGRRALLRECRRRGWAWRVIGARQVEVRCPRAGCYEEYIRGDFEEALRLCMAELDDAHEWMREHEEG